MTSTDLRLVELYDLDNPPGADHGWFRALAGRVGAETIVDLGCGTGSLTVTFPAEGRRVIGVDPEEAMLDFARQRAGADQVTWVHGDSRSIPAVAADLVVMSGNVAQHIVGSEWVRTLGDLSRVVRPGGSLAFESRNPAVRAWEGWNKQSTYGRRGTPGGPLTEWMDVTDVSDDGTVTFEAHNVFEATGETIVQVHTLAFRSLDHLTADLAQAGFTLTQVYGGWSGEPVSAAAPILVLQAIRSLH